MYTDLTNEQEKYITISKIGVTGAEMKRCATIQLSILFFVPYIMASIHTMFATKMLQDVIGLSLFKEVSAVLIIFGFVEIVFSYSFAHFICRSYHNILIHIKRLLHEKVGSLPSFFMPIILGGLGE